MKQTNVSSSGIGFIGLLTMNYFDRMYKKLAKQREEKEKRNRIKRAKAKIRNKKQTQLRYWADKARENAI